MTASSNTMQKSITEINSLVLSEFYYDSFPFQPRFQYFVCAHFIEFYSKGDFLNSIY